MMIAHMVKLQPNSLQLTLEEYKSLYDLLVHANELRPCCLSGRMIGRMFESTGYPKNYLCSCLNEKRDESVRHFLCDYPALQGRRNTMSR